MHLINDFLSAKDSFCYQNYHRIYDHDTGCLCEDFSELEVEPPLHYASRHGLIDNVAALIKQNVEVNSYCAHGRLGTALSSAAAGGHVHIVELLLNAGAEVTLHHPGCYTPLQAACMNGFPEIVSHILKVGADVDYVDDTIDGMTALQHTCWYRSHHQEKTVSAMFDAGADVNRRGRLSHSPSATQLACKIGNTKIVAQLLNAGADPNSTGGYLDPPLETAVTLELCEMMTLLIDAGADPNIHDKQGRSSLWHARRSQEPEKDGMIQMLLKAGAVDEVDAPDTVQIAKAVVAADDGDEGDKNSFPSTAESRDDDRDVSSSEGERNGDHSSGCSIRPGS